ncbi:hypothetical protein [Streptosporangium sp. NPDC023615]
MEDLRRVLPRLEGRGGPHRTADDAGGFAHGAEARRSRRHG